MIDTYEFLSRSEQQAQWRADRGLSRYDSSQDDDTTPMSYSSGYPSQLPSRAHIEEVREYLGREPSGLLAAVKMIYSLPEYPRRAELIRFLLCHLTGREDLSVLRQNYTANDFNVKSGVVMGMTFGGGDREVSSNIWEHPVTTWSAEIAPRLSGRGTLTMPWIGSLRPESFKTLDWLLFHVLFGVCKTDTSRIAMPVRDPHSPSGYTWLTLGDRGIRTTYGMLHYWEGLWGYLRSGDPQVHILQGRPPEPMCNVYAIQEPCTGFWLTYNHTRKTKEDSHASLPSMLRRVWSSRSDLPGRPWKMTWNVRFCIIFALECRLGIPEVRSFLEEGGPYPRSLLGIDRPKPSRRRLREGRLFQVDTSPETLGFPPTAGSTL